MELGDEAPVSYLLNQWQIGIWIQNNSPSQLWEFFRKWDYTEFRNVDCLNQYKTKIDVSVCGSGIAQRLALGKQDLVLLDQWAGVHCRSASENSCSLSDSLLPVDVEWSLCLQWQLFIVKLTCAMGINWHLKVKSKIGLSICSHSTFGIGNKFHGDDLI